MRVILTKVEFEELSDEDLIQTIGESKKRESKNLNSALKNELFERRIITCEILNRIEFTIESYGFINFLIEYEEEIVDLERLREILIEFNENETILAINKSLDFYISNKEEIKYLKSNPIDYDKKFAEMNTNYQNIGKAGLSFHIPFNKTIINLASYIRNNINEFCLLQTINQIEITIKNDKNNIHKEK